VRLRDGTGEDRFGLIAHEDAGVGPPLYSERHVSQARRRSPERDRSIALGADADVARVGACVARTCAGALVGCVRCGQRVNAAHAAV
jgi:hypothetical protein